MGIDKETEPNWVNIVLDDNPVYLKELREQAEADDQNEKGKTKRLSLTMDTHTFEPSEIYFEEEDSALFFSGELKSSNGSSHVSLSIPISDVVLIDILAEGVKKLNKLKTALEALK